MSFEQFYFISLFLYLASHFSFLISRFSFLICRFSFHLTFFLSFISRFPFLFCFSHFLFFYSSNLTYPFHPFILFSHFLFSIQISCFYLFFFMTSRFSLVVVIFFLFFWFVAQFYFLTLIHIFILFNLMGFSSIFQFSSFLTNLANSPWNINVTFSATFGLSALKASKRAKIIIKFITFPRRWVGWVSSWMHSTTPEHDSSWHSNGDVETSWLGSSKLKAVARRHHEGKLASLFKLNAPSRLEMGLARDKRWKSLTLQRMVRDASLGRKNKIIRLFFLILNVIEIELRQIV